MATTREIIAETEQWGAHNYKPLPVVLTHGEGVWVYDTEGNRYLDFLACYSALNQGHRHPRIAEALKRQLDRITLTSRAFHNDQLGGLCHELAQLCRMEMVLPMNTGAEAVETALKAARKWAYETKKVPSGRAEIIACEGNFHGRTLAIVSFSTEPLYRDAFGPFTPGFKIIPYGDAAALEAAITENTAAFLVEPIQGENGVVVPPDGYLRQAREICSKRRVLFVADEIQTGFGRTGTMFATEHERVQPDLMILGKALGGGYYPVSAVVGSREVLGLFTPGEHGSTFGGNPLAAAVARESIRVLVEENLAGRSAELGAYLIERLRAIRSPHVKQVRGRGLFAGVVLNEAAGGARQFCEALMRRGMLCKETHEHVIRFAPPLTIQRSDIDWALERIEPVLVEGK
ncbi:MAG: ornithine--oxo-acid transaminase [Pseudomonadota bacterium]